MVGKQKSIGGNGGVGDSEANNDPMNGFRETKRASRNRMDGNVEEARPLRRSFDSRQNNQARNNAGIVGSGEQSPVEANGPFAAMMAKLEMPRKAQWPFLIAIILCVILFVILICLVAFWPRIPAYMNAEVCTDKECLDASQQMLIWANTSVNTCEDPYGWACGKFDDEYSKHSFYGYSQGDWNFKTYQEYKEIVELDQFISQLPTSSLSYTASSILTGLYKSCRDLETLDKAQAEVQLKKAIHLLDGWGALRDSKRLQMWDYKKSLIHLQAIYGSFPFFKISVENRVSFPYGKIITIDEGEVGLPHRKFYDLDSNHKIVNAYKMLLRDFAINMGIIVEDAKLFANQIFHYEQRILHEIRLKQESSDNEQNQILTLGEIKRIAPSLPIFESVRAIFTKIKITEKTEVLVRNIDVLGQMSIIVSTSDKQPLNDFIIWSLARKYLPFMSREYRASVQEFEKVLYGQISTPPNWYFCAKTIRDWIPFGIDVLKQNQTLRNQPILPIDIDEGRKADSFVNSNYEKSEELFKLMFHHIKNEVQQSIEKADWIKPDGRHYLSNMLGNIKLQVGIPKMVIETSTYMNEYYEDLLLQNLFFVDHLEPFWTFTKRQMEKKLSPTPNSIDVIVFELYPGTEEKSKLLTFSASLNMAIISRKALEEPYFHYKYPLGLNFARIGTDIAELLLRMAFLYSSHYNDKQNSANNTFGTINLIGDSTACLTRNVDDKSMPNTAIPKLYRRISSVHIASQALRTFLHKTAKSEAFSGSAVSETISYSDLQLDQQKRQAGMRKYDDEQLFTLAELQRYCSVVTEEYSTYKPYITDDIAEKESFDIMWKHLKFLPRSFSCSAATAQKCSDIL